VRLAGFLTGNTNPAIVRRELQLAMWNGAGIFRNAQELEKTLSAARQLSTARLRAASSRSLPECCIVQNMCLTASLICRGALLRTESRGAHLRTDITQSHDAEHSPFGHTCLSQAGEGIETRGVKP